MGATASILENLTEAFTQNAPYAQSPPLYVSLHSADPGPLGLNEVTNGTGAQARQLVTFGTGTTGLDTSNVALNFAVASGYVGWLGYWTAQTGGTWLGGYPLTISPFVAIGTHGSASIWAPGHGLAAGRALRPFLIPGVASAIPTPLSAGGVYYVYSVPSVDQLTLATSPGGSQITCGTSGGFQLGLDQSINFGSSAGVFVIPAGHLSYQTVS